MRQNCNTLLSPSLIVDRNDSFSAASVFVHEPTPPSLWNGVNCAMLKVWVGWGQAPLMAVGTQEKGSYKLKGDMMGKSHLRTGKLSILLPLLNRSAVVVCNVFMWRLPLLTWKCCKDAESVQKSPKQEQVFFFLIFFLNELCSCSCLQRTWWKRRAA